MAVVGAKEMESNTLSVRTRGGGELGALTIEHVLERLVKANAEQDNF
jgi:threonyl-tRNA synthetase